MIVHTFSIQNLLWSSFAQASMLCFCGGGVLMNQCMRASEWSKISPCQIGVSLRTNVCLRTKTEHPRQPVISQVKRETNGDDVCDFWKNYQKRNPSWNIRSSHHSSGYFAQAKQLSFLIFFLPYKRLDDPKIRTVCFRVFFGEIAIGFFRGWSWGWFWGKLQVLWPQQKRT